ncbi:MAG: glycosyltransferase [Lentisphaerae bacterium]|nr:glycosyltransferase [Lentisphaerota bacterium]
MTNFPDKWSDLNVALCHDWLTGMRGGERVLEILCQGFPGAGIHTLIHKPSAISDIINCHPIHTSWLQFVPGITHIYRHLLPLFPLTVELMPRPKADLLLSTSHCVIKSLRTRPETKHLCYCFTPMRYAWSFYEEYFGRNRMKAFIALFMLPILRRWDKNTASRVTRFVAISKHVQKRIMDFYGRDSDVVYPPVNTEHFTPDTESHGNFDLIVSALVPYKRIDLAVNAYNKLGYPLTIVGVGSESQHLRASAGPNIKFLGWESNERILHLYRTCRMLVFPGEEDFGIVPLEAQSCGKPVVAYAKGGTMETIIDDVTGVFFPEQTVDSILDAIDHCAARRWDSAAIRSNAERFSIQRFVNGMAESITKCMSMV